MEHIKQRYFETRDGRCLPFQQIGEHGQFCIVLDGCMDALGVDRKCRYFVPNLADANDIVSSVDSWRFNRPSPELFQNEGDVERQANDILDLANIFRMVNFQIMGNCEVATWLAAHHPERVQVISTCSSRVSEDCEVMLSS